MFKKYFAHEFKNTCQMPITVCALIIGVSVLVGLGALLKLEFLLSLGIIALVVSFYACFIMSYISIHKTMTGRLFSKGGYLTLTLPVGTHTILISKILINLIYVIGYIASIFIGVFVILAGFGLFESLKVTFSELLELTQQLMNNFDVVLIQTTVALIAFVFFLCLILFCNAFTNSGYLKKQSKVVNFIITVGFIILVAYIMSIDIIPFALTYRTHNSNGYEIISTNADDFIYLYGNVLDFSSLFWMLAGIFGFYFGSYYLIKNKIDIL